MYRIMGSLFLSCSICCGLFSCASTIKKSDAAMLLPEIDVVQVKENSDEALRIAQEAKLNVDVVNTKVAEIDNKLVALSEEVSAVSLAKIEELENRLSLLIEALKDIQAQLSAIEVMPQVRVNTPANKNPGIPTFAPSSAGGVLLTTPEFDAYQKALDSFKSKNYKQASQLFSDVIKQFPDGKFIDNCQYWIGECAYAQRDFASAIAAFNKVFAYQNSSKGDDAQLKLALSYLKMGQNALAKAEFSKLIDRYPGSEYAPRAKEYLQTLQ